MTRSPPLRFLAAVLGGWAALRTALVAPPWTAPTADAAGMGASARARQSVRAGAAVGPGTSAQVAAGGRGLFDASTEPLPPATRRGAPESAAAPFPRPAPAPPAAGLARPATIAAAALPASAALQRPVTAAHDSRSTPAKRWSLSAWSFVRSGGPTALAAGGLLGASQAGARFTYRLNRDRSRPLALSFRLSSALQRRPAAEAALGLDWQPDRRLPVHIVAERRQALSREGRSAFAVTVHGGVSDAPVGPFRLDAYGQAGLVGTRSRDPFGDGALRLSIPVGSVRLGAGVWAAAQPGLSRLDLGPQAAIRLPVAGRTATLAADWRIRVAGNANPGSGPALTLATDF